MRRVISLFALLLWLTGVACSAESVETTPTEAASREQSPAATEPSPETATEPPAPTEPSAAPTDEPVTKPTPTTEPTDEPEVDSTPATNPVDSSEPAGERIKLVQLWPEPVSEMRWPADNAIWLLQESSREAETGCVTNQWQSFAASWDGNQIAVNNEPIMADPECPDVEQPTTAPSLPGDVWGSPIWSSDGQTALYWILADSLAAPIFVGSETEQSDDSLPLYEGWIAGSGNSNPYPLIATRRNYGASWSPDSSHLLLYGLCYGDNLGNGLYTVNLAAETSHTVADSFSLCEGTNFPQFSPDSQYLLYGPGQITSVSGEPLTALCTINQYARSYAWSTDSQNAFAACAGTGSDVLMRYTLASGAFDDLSDLLAIPLEPLFQEMFLSPRGDWLAFIWGASEFSGQEQNGVWLLRLDPLE